MSRQKRSDTVALAEVVQLKGNPSKIVRFDDVHLSVREDHTNETSDGVATPVSLRCLRPRHKSAPPREPTPELEPCEDKVYTKKTKPTQQGKPKTRRRRKVTNRMNILKYSMVVSTEMSRTAASHEHFLLRDARRDALRELQAEQDPRKTAQEPDLNDRSEVRHFEVDEQGSLTLIVFETKEAWLLSEVVWDGSDEGVQVVAGRAYKVTRV